MTNSDALPPAPVLRGHPLVLAPVVVVAIVVRVADGVAAARVAFVVAAGGVLVIEFTARLLVRTAWSRHVRPPSENEPAGLVPPLAASAWAIAAGSFAGRLDEADGAAVLAGVRGCQVAIAIQLYACLASAARHRVRPTDGTLTTGPGTGAR